MGKKQTEWRKWEVFRRRMSGKSVAEVAQEMGLHTNTVYTLYNKAVAELDEYDKETAARVKQEAIARRSFLLSLTIDEFERLKNYPTHDVKEVAMLSDTMSRHMKNAGDHAAAIEELGGLRTKSPLVSFMNQTLEAPRTVIFQLPSGENRNIDDLSPAELDATIKLLKEPDVLEGEIIEDA